MLYVLHGLGKTSVNFVNGNVLEFELDVVCLFNRGHHFVVILVRVVVDDGSLTGQVVGCCLAVVSEDSCCDQARSGTPIYGGQGHVRASASTATGRSRTGTATAPPPRPRH